MKRQFYLFFFLFIGYFSVNAQQVLVTDKSNVSTPTAGAMFDVDSDSKGFMLPRVALTGFKDVTTIPSRTTGLMVYNNGTAGLTDKGIYFWNDTVWVKQLSAGSSSTSYVTIAGDGTVKLNGGATTYDDLRVDGSRVQNSGVTAPFWGVFVGGLYVNQFQDAKVQSVYFNVQMPHAWKEGSDIFPHVHWCGMSAPSTNKVVWGLEYQWVNVGSSFNLTTNPTILTGNLPVTNTNINSDNSLADGEHAITPLGVLTGTGQTFSSVLICRLVRYGDDSNDTFQGSAAMLSIDFHYQIDSFGTSSEYSKN